MAELTAEQQEQLNNVYQVSYDRARRQGCSMHEAAHRAVKARNIRRLSLMGQEAFPGQCPGLHPDTGERCAYTEHERALEYHSWVRVVQS